MVNHFDQNKQTKILHKTIKANLYKRPYSGINEEGAELQVTAKEESGIDYFGSIEMSNIVKSAKKILKKYNKLKQKINTETGIDLGAEIHGQQLKCQDLPNKTYYVFQHLPEIKRFFICEPCLEKNSKSVDFVERGHISQFNSSKVPFFTQLRELLVFLFKAFEQSIKNDPIDLIKPHLRKILSRFEIFFSVSTDEGRKIYKCEELQNLYNLEDFVRNYFFCSFVELQLPRLNKEDKLNNLQIFKRKTHGFIQCMFSNRLKGIGQVNSQELFSTKFFKNNQNLLFGNEDVQKRVKNFLQTLANLMLIVLLYFQDFANRSAQVFNRSDRKLDFEKVVDILRFLMDFVTNVNIYFFNYFDFFTNLFFCTLVQKEMKFFEGSSSFSNINVGIFFYSIHKFLYTF